MKSLSVMLTFAVGCLLTCQAFAQDVSAFLASVPGVASNAFLAVPDDAPQDVHYTAFNACSEMLESRNTMTQSVAYATRSRQTVMERIPLVRRLRFEGPRKGFGERRFAAPLRWVRRIVPFGNC